MAVKDISDAQVCAAVQAFRDRDLDPPWPYEALAIETGQPEKVCYRAMERAERRGLIDVGVSLRAGWLSEKGKALLAEARGATA